jgi:hypothetical protein
MRVRNEEVLHRVKEERNIVDTIKRRKANWIGHILRRNCLLKHVIEGKLEGTRRRGRRREQLLGDWNWKEEAIAFTLLKNLLWEGAVDVARQTKKWKKEYSMCTDKQGSWTLEKLTESDSKRKGHRAM